MDSFFFTSNKKLRQFAVICLAWNGVLAPPWARCLTFLLDSFFIYKISLIIPNLQKVSKVKWGDIYNRSASKYSINISYYHIYLKNRNKLNTVTLNAADFMIFGNCFFLSSSIYLFTYLFMYFFYKE